MSQALQIPPFHVWISLCVDHIMAYAIQDVLCSSNSWGDASQYSVRYPQFHTVQYLVYF